jgi:hypothetical protein
MHLHSADPPAMAAAQPAKPQRSAYSDSEDDESTAPMGGDVAHAEINRAAAQMDVQWALQQLDTLESALAFTVTVSGKVQSVTRDYAHLSRL